MIRESLDVLEDLGVVSHSDIPRQVLSWAFAGNCALDSGAVMSWIGGTFQRFQDLTQSWQVLVVTGMLFYQERDDIDFNRHGRRDKTEIQFELSSDKWYTVTIVLEAVARKAYRGRLMTIDKLATFWHPKLTSIILRAWRASRDICERANEDSK